MFMFWRVCGSDGINSDRQLHHHIHTHAHTVPSGCTIQTKEKLPKTSREPKKCHTVRLQNLKQRKLMSPVLSLTSPAKGVASASANWPLFGGQCLIFKNIRVY